MPLEIWVRGYKRITIFENNRRLELLTKFRASVVEYFSNSKASLALGDRTEDRVATEARAKINLILDQAHDAIVSAGVNPTIRWTPPPMIGGYVQSFDLVVNIFNFVPYEIRPNQLLDLIDRSIGIYHADQRAARIRTLNPLFYLGLGLDWLAGLPFLLARRAGLSESTFENSFIGKLVKLAIYLIGGIASLLTALQLLGALDAFRSWSGI